MEHESQHPPTIELDGVRLRPLRVADAAALYTYLRDPAVTELTSYPVVSVRLVEGMIERSLSRWAAGELAKWGVALQHDDELVGTCGFNEWSEVHRWAELAYDLAQAHWGKGLMRQAMAAVLQWSYRQDQVDRVHAFVRVDNTRSQRLLENSGFVREGCLRSYRVCRGQPHDFYIYGLLRSDWAAAQQPVGASEAPRCCSVTLIVVGDDLEPDVVTSTLGWPPVRSWRPGERKRFIRPDGTERIFDSVHKWGGWKLFTADDERGRPLQDQVAAWLERLRDKNQALQSLRYRGWEVELDCFAATSECLDLPATVLGELAGLGVGLALTFSAGEP